MKKNIFKQTSATVPAALVAAIIGLIVNSFTQWWKALANVTNAGWGAVSQATVSAIAYRVPILTVVVAVALVALTWYATRKIGGALKGRPPRFLTYTQDFFDGVLCRWNYSPRVDGSYEIGDIRCYCQHCYFVIGTPNEHAQTCHSCSRRSVKNDNPPLRLNFRGDITGYQFQESSMTFETFIRREIERRVETDEWCNSSKA